MHQHSGSLLLGLALALALVTHAAVGVNVKCVDVPHNKIQINDMLGTWYPMEIVLHRNDSKIYGVPVDRPCAEVTVEPAQPNKRTYRLLWNTTDGELEFRLSQKGPRDSAQFTVLGDQIGGLLQKGDYKHFGGTMHVLKLDTDFLFMTFCSKKDWILSTVGLSRKDAIPEKTTKELMQEMDDVGYKMFREIHVVKECKSDGGGAIALLPLCVLPFLSICVLSCLTGWLVH